MFFSHQKYPEGFLFFLIDQGKQHKLILTVETCRQKKNGMYEITFVKTFGNNIFDHMEDAELCVLSIAHGFKTI